GVGLAELVPHRLGRPTLEAGLVARVPSVEVDRLRKRELLLLTARRGGGWGRAGARLRGAAGEHEREPCHRHGEPLGDASHVYSFGSEGVACARRAPQRDGSTV